MSISFPLSLPATDWPAEISFRAQPVVAASVSPFTFETQVFVHPGARWAASVRLQPMKRAVAEEWVGFLVALNGMEGTFNLGDPLNTSPRGTWSTPLVDGTHAERVRTVAMKAMGGAGVTGKRGDWLQFGSGANAHLHKVVQDFVADGSGLADVEIWPATRAALADNDAVTIVSAVGLWRLAANDTEWSIGRAQMYGIAFDCVEAL